MNKKQRIVVIVALVLVAVCGLFPPYEGEYPMKGDNLRAYIGYRFLFAPPSREQMMREIWQDRFVDMKRHTYRCRASIIVSRIYVQIVVIVTLTAGLLLLFRNAEHSRPSNKPDAGDG
jgi:hypothetical protein